MKTYFLISSTLVGSMSTINNMSKCHGSLYKILIFFHKPPSLRFSNHFLVLTTNFFVNGCAISNRNLNEQKNQFIPMFHSFLLLLPCQFFLTIFLSTHMIEILWICTQKKSVSASLLFNNTNTNRLCEYY